VKFMNQSVLPTIVIATRNAGKRREFQALLRPLNCDILSLEDFADVTEGVEIEESGSTFAENAGLKATGYSLLVPFPVLADDSGLEVDALGGRPGIHSARYGGTAASDTDRIHKLLGELEGCEGERNARFVCALALARNGEVIAETEASCSGVIIREMRGSEGFGYDPVFLLSELGRTFAELDQAEKNQYSHRARAVAGLQSLIVNRELLAQRD
jgi:XTP/dITP diphosphohydrolase